jgi:hypothetical protein
VCLCWCRPCLPWCPVIGVPYRHAWSFVHQLLSSTADTTYSHVQLTQLSRSPSVYVKAISAEVPVVHPTIKVYKSHS